MGLLGGTTVVAKKILWMAAVFAGVLLLGGCGRGRGGWTPGEPTAISIAEDGTVTEIVQETFDASYYNADELQSMITSEVSQYNTENGEGSVEMEEFSAEDGTVSLQMKYASASDYAEFNNTEFYYGSMIDAQLEGYLFDVGFKQVRNGTVHGSEVTGSEVIKNMADQVLVVRAPLEIKVPGNVTFTSSNAEVLSADVVNATGEQEEEEDAGLVLPSSAVYREESTYTEKTEANRVYIIFEME